MTTREKLFMGIGLAVGLAIGYQAPDAVERIFELGLGAVAFAVLLVIALCIALFVPFLQGSFEIAYHRVALWLRKAPVIEGAKRDEVARPPVNPWGMPNPPYPHAPGDGQRGHRR